MKLSSVEKKKQAQRILTKRSFMRNISNKNTISFLLEHWFVYTLKKETLSIYYCKRFLHEFLSFVHLKAYSQ